MRPGVDGKRLLVYHDDDYPITSPETAMELRYTTCPKCGGTATLLQRRDDSEEVPDPNRPTGTTRLPIKVEEFRCQEQNCEHEFEKVIREPTSGE
jgi:hypothetical protein